MTGIKTHDSQSTTLFTGECLKTICLRTEKSAFPILLSNIFSDSR